MKMGKLTKTAEERNKTLKVDKASPKYTGIGGVSSYHGPDNPVKHGGYNIKRFSVYEKILSD